MTDSTTTTDPHAATGNLHVHVMPRGVLIAVFVALVALTLVTVIAAQIPTGSLEIWISLGIASVKAGLVAAYFMHLRYDKPFNALMLVASIFFVGLFLALTLADSKAYQPEIELRVRSSAGRATHF